MPENAMTGQPPVFSLHDYDDPRVKSGFDLLLAEMKRPRLLPPPRIIVTSVTI